MFLIVRYCVNFLWRCSIILLELEEETATAGAFGREIECEPWSILASVVGWTNRVNCGEMVNGSLVVFFALVMG